MLDDLGGGWRVPEHARVMVDRFYLLAPIGLLSLSGREVQARSVAETLMGQTRSSETRGHSE